MNINSEYDKDGVGNSEEAMEACMSVLSNILIEPAIANDLLDGEQAEMLGTVADAFTIIARKARCYEKMLDKDNTSPYTNN
tara:strand:- start:571 stop:813 length:243 start_codon:yes stop_codon:yes gene_type:complete